MNREILIDGILGASGIHLVETGSRQLQLQSRGINAIRKEAEEICQTIKPTAFDVTDPNTGNIIHVNIRDEDLPRLYGECVEAKQKELSGEVINFDTVTGAGFILIGLLLLGNIVFKRVKALEIKV